jgi:7,8-dihydro-6-hydroxymethylpterin-pyrophosphokinase
MNERPFVLEPLAEIRNKSEIITIDVELPGIGN